MTFNDSPCVGKNFSGLPVVDSLIQHALTQGEPLSCLKNTALLYVHHPLKTSVNLLKGVIALGFDPKHIFVLGKHYSESKEVVKKTKELGVHYQASSVQLKLGGFSECFMHDVERLWLLAEKELGSQVDSIVVADHGGYVLSAIPARMLKRYKIVGLEKTTGGLIAFEGLKPPLVPVVNVAGCRAKKELESPLIVDAVMKKLEKIISSIDLGLTCGVIGFGSIGQALAEKLLSLGYRVVVLEREKSASSGRVGCVAHRFSVVDNMSDLLESADYVFGCTGRDVFKGNHFFEAIAKKITFVSCSSGDKEFLSLLKLIQTRHESLGVVSHPLDNLVYRTSSGGALTVLRGGFPVNFDDSGESVPEADIQLTRALVLAGILQCIRLLSTEERHDTIKFHELDDGFQQIVTNKWLEENKLRAKAKTANEKELLV